LVQTPEAQSLLAPQPLVFGHDGAQAAGAHLPLVQTPEPQSVDAPQTLS
jgi:hypothetical protein